MSSSIVRSSNLAITKKPLQNLQGGDKDSGGALVSIYESLININNIVSRRTKETQNTIKQRKQVEDKKEKKIKEDKLEYKPEKKKIDLPKIKTPFSSFFDRLKNALVLLFVGWLVNRFWDYVPKILEGVSNFMKTLEDIRKFLKPATDALGSALYNITLTGTKVLGSITGAQIDKNEKNLAVAVNELDKKFSIIDALLAGIVISDIFSAVADGLNLFERPGRTPTVDQRRVPKASQQRYYQRFGRNAFIRKFGEEAIDNLPKNMQRGFLQRGARNVGAMALKGARNTFGGGAVRLAGKAFGRIPIIGGLINFVINLAMGENPGRAAAKAVGSTVGAALGTFIPIPFVGTILGGVLGDLLGGVVYDALAPKKTSKKGPRKKQEAPKGYFLGGLVSGIKGFFSGRSTTVSKPSLSSARSQKITQQAPSYSKNIKPITLDKNVVDKVGQTVIDGFLGVGQFLSQIPYVGPFVSLGISLAIGKERFSKSTALSIAAGIGNLIGNPLAIGIYNFLDKSLPGLGKLVQKVVGKDFGIFLSNWITQFLGQKLYESLYPSIDFIKNIITSIKASAQKTAEQESKKELDGDVTPVNVPAGKDAKIKEAIAFYKSKGFSDTGAAYMVGNLLQESGLNPGAVGDNGKAFGLAQWRVDAAAGARWLGYLNWAKTNNKQPGDFYAQLEYTIVEGQKYNAGLTSMKGSDKNAHKNFIRGYEGYSVEGNRFGFAEDILKNPEKYGLTKQQGGGETKKLPIDLKKNRQASILPNKPSSIAASSYAQVSQFPSYEKDKLQIVRQVVYVPLQQQKPSGGGVVVMGGDSVNNIDYQIAATKAAL